MRSIAIGHSALMDGFALLGMETFPDANENDLDQLLKELIRNREKAMIYLQKDLAESELEVLQKLRKEGGNILISEIPSLISSDDYLTPLDQLITRVLGQKISIGQS